MNIAKPPHPGKTLLKEFLNPLAISQNQLARTIFVPPRRINEIVLGKRAVTPDTSIRLGKYFGLSSKFFIDLQTIHDINKKEEELEEIIKKITPFKDKNNLT